MRFFHRLKTVVLFCHFLPFHRRGVFFFYPVVLIWYTCTHTLARTFTLTRLTCAIVFLFFYVFYVQCHTKIGGGGCEVHDAGPKLTAHLKQEVGERWALALVDVCDWVRDTVFSAEIDASELGNEAGRRVG